MSGIGAPELIIVLIIVLLLFGSTKLPKLARSLGEAKNEFEKTSRDGDAAKAASTPAAAVAADDEKVTMSKAELDALLAERDAAKAKDA